MASRPALIRASIEQHLASLATLPQSVATIERIAAALERTLAQGGKVWTCGNGGSAAEALHLAEEMIGRFSRNRAPLAAACLSSDSTVLTCIANDFGYEEVFARQVEGLGRQGDALVVLTTSGQSPNIVRALLQAKRMGLTTIGLLGPPDSPAQMHCDLALTLSVGNSAHIQEAHLIAIHLILEHLDVQA